MPQKKIWSEEICAVQKCRENLNCLTCPNRLLAEWSALSDGEMKKIQEVVDNDVVIEVWPEQ